FVSFTRNPLFYGRADICPRNRADPTQREASRLQHHGLSFGIAKLFLSAHTVANQEKESSEQAKACDASEDHAEPWGIFSDDTHANHPHEPATSEQDHKSHKYPEQHQQRVCPVSRRTR